ncbi:MAG TPA: TonB-dependent receptor [Cellvibrio sp.]|nr:TonB-dependent receptor [Cellvibrio sp.]
MAALSFTGNALAEARVEGFIHIAEQEIPLAGVQVHLKELNREVVSQRDGRFVFLDVKPGNYTLITSYIGVEPIEKKITVADQENLSLDFAMQATKGSVAEILVIGQAASINKALNKQRTADNIITLVSADAIGQFPDTNVSEALQRLPGLSIERDQGEGRYVRVRGMGPDFNAVTINGVAVPGPDADRRVVALDVIPSDLLESLMVTKSLTPDMDANSLGGSIDVQSLSAFDRDSFFYQFTAEGSYDENTEQTSPKLSFTTSNRFSLGEGEDNFGIAAGISHFKREFGSDNVETGGHWDFSDNNALLEEFEQRKYHISRERSGATLNFDYKVSENSDLYWRNLYSEYTDSEIRLANVVEFADGTAAGETQAAEVQRELKDRTETQKILSTSFGGQSRFDKWTLDYRLSHNQSGEEEPTHIGGAVFKLDDDVIEDEVLDLSYRNSRKILITAPNSYYQAASYKLDEVELADNDGNDTSNAINIDLTRELDWHGIPAQLKFGIKHNRREKDNDTQISVAEEFLGDTSLTAFAGNPVSYALGNFGQSINSAKVKSAIKEAELDEEESSINDFEITEDQDAAYLMGRIDIDNWRLLTGVRYEATDFSAKGFAYEADKELISNTYFANKDDYFLPALHLRYTLDDKTQVRAAWTNSVVRPNFAQLSPGRLIEEDDGDIEASFGNPDLKSLKSRNIDLGIEHYTGVAGVVSAFAFYKKIDNFAYEADLGGRPGYQEFTKAITYVNGETADIYGLELAASQQLKSLPAPWNGLLLGANATLVKSTATIGAYDNNKWVTRELSLPSQSDTSANFMLGYETNKLSMRLSANLKSKYLLEVADPLDANYDTYVDAQTQVDFSLHYYITNAIKINVEALNLTNEVYYTYENKKAHNVQYEEYGSTFKLGVTLTNF